MDKHCAMCGKEIDKGDEIYDDYDNPYCSDECFQEALDKFL